MFNIKKYYNEPLYINSIALILNTVGDSFFGLLFWIVAARTISTKDIGLATAILSASTLIVTLTRFGMDSGLIRFLPISKNKDDFYSSTLIITMVTPILLSIIYLLCLNWFFPSLLFLRDGFIPLIFISYIILYSISSTQSTALIALRRGELSFYNNLISGVRVPLLLFVSVFGLIGIFVAFEISFIVKIILGIYFTYLLGINFKLRFSLESIKDSFLFSLGNYTASICSMISTSLIPILILNITGAENCAYYYVAYMVASMLFVIPGAISMSLFVEGSYDIPLKDNLLKSLKFIMILLIPSIIVIFLFGDKILLLFNKEFSEQSFELLKLLAISSLFLTISSIYITIKRIQKDVKSINYINLLSTIIILATGYIFLQEYGLIGIGYAWLLNNIIISIIVLLLIIKEKNLIHYINIINK